MNNYYHCKKIMTHDNKYKKYYAKRYSVLFIPKNNSKNYYDTTKMVFWDQIDLLSEYDNPEEKINCDLVNKIIIINNSLVPFSFDLRKYAPPGQINFEIIIDRAYKQHSIIPYSSQLNIKITFILINKKYLHSSYLPFVLIKYIFHFLDQGSIINYYD